MPYIGQNTAPTIDTNAVSHDRHRRNWQALVNGALQFILKLATNSGLMNGTGGLGVQLNTLSGLQVSSGGLSVEVQTAGALNINSSGLGVNVDGSTITINGSDQLVSHSSGGVTSVGLTGAADAPVFSISGSPITSSGSITLGFANGSTTDFLAVNATGTASLRAITAPDVAGLALSLGTSTFTLTSSQAGGTHANVVVTSTYTAAGSAAKDVDLLIARTEGTPQNNNKQYTLLITKNGTTLASIDNSGFFYTNNGINASTGFTQNGDFVIDANGQYVNLVTQQVTTDQYGHYYGIDTYNPTIAAGTGAGTSPTISIAGNDTGGIISLTLGTLPAGSGATVATVTFANAWITAPVQITLTPANAATVALGALAPYVDSTTLSTTIFKILSNTSALTGGPFKWYYIVTG